MSTLGKDDLLHEDVEWHRKKKPLDIVWGQSQLDERRHIAKHVLNPQEAWAEIRPSLTSQRLGPIRERVYQNSQLGPRIHKMKLHDIRITDPVLVEGLNRLAEAYRTAARAELKLALDEPTYAYVNKSNAYPAALHLISRPGFT